MAPFRKVYRLQTARIAIKLRAAWRHPANSHKRKAYRANRMSEYASAIASGIHLPTDLMVKLRALIHHPFSAKRRRGYPEQLRAVPSEPAAILNSSGSAVGLDSADAVSTDAGLFRHHIQNAINASALGDYVPLSTQPIVSSRCDVKLIAYYLPQFHPIPENNTWWGKGFTEWRNVARAFPVFEGHYQPRVPGELGYYDLRLIDNVRRQVELAKHYGVSAFCFHFYWFGGKRLLELPIESFLNNKDLDLQFCLCWANENWSRRWDGGDNEVLIAQSHSPHDDIAFIRYLNKYFQDSRYMTVDGKPVLTVYRPAIIPNVKDTVDRWRAEALKMGLPGLYLIATNSFGFVDYAKYGFDALSEFPPNSGSPTQIKELTFASLRTGGVVYSYQSLVASEVNKPEFSGTVHPGIMPSWDNSARRPYDGQIFHGSTPALFSRWLHHCLNRARRHRLAERLVFVNAWNEWAEGTYLEPDQRYGYAYLNAVKDELSGHHQVGRRVLIVSHDAFPHGAQFIALNLARIFGSVLGYKVDIVLLGAGDLESEFDAAGTVHNLAGRDPGGPEARELVTALYGDGCTTAICNTVVAGLFASTLKRAGFRVVSLVHELPGFIVERGLEKHAATLAANSDAIVFPAQLVRHNFEQFGKSKDGTCILPQGIYSRPTHLSDAEKKDTRARLRQDRKLKPESRILLGVGYADYRKGIDLFVETAAALVARRPDVVALWVGHFDALLEPQIRKRVAQLEMEDHILFPGRVPNTTIGSFYAGADIYLLTSREDPFPSVVLEAFAAGLPVIAFDGASGTTELLEGGCGRVVPAFDTGAMADAAAELLNDEFERTRLGKRAQELVADGFRLRSYAFDLAVMADPTLKRVSIVVPSYNYRHCIEERLRSIAAQTYPIYEVIVVDDASTDGSVEWLQRHLHDIVPEARLIACRKNSGSATGRWLEATEVAQGEFIWIAEADDLAEPDFLAEVLQNFTADVVLSYCQSQQMDVHGRILSNDYLAYTSSVSENKWKVPYLEDGLSEIRTTLSVKNTIPNVSAVLFRRLALLETLRAVKVPLSELHVAGDWLVYVELLTRGKIAFTPQPLNKHRRHTSSVTSTLNTIRHLREILHMQELVRSRFGTTGDVCARARAYAQDVYRHFGLNAGDYADAADHPHLRDFFAETVPSRDRSGENGGR
jgi:glycosyltransferase involved in cell wall biosynthesis